MTCPYGRTGYRIVTKESTETRTEIVLSSNYSSQSFANDEIHKRFLDSGSYSGLKNENENDRDVRSNTVRNRNRNGENDVHDNRNIDGKIYSHSRVGVMLNEDTDPGSDSKQVLIQTETSYLRCQMPVTVLSSIRSNNDPSGFVRVHSGEILMSNLQKNQVSTTKKKKIVDDSKKKIISSTETTTVTVTETKNLNSKDNVYTEKSGITA